MTASAVRVEGVFVRRGDAVLLDDVNLSAARGEIVGIVGPNGAGKTTLLRVIAGDLAPSQGSAFIFDHNSATATLPTLAGLRSYLGPQGRSDIQFSVRDIVTMGRHPHRLANVNGDDHRDIVDSAMNRCDVLHLSERVVKSLSTGEQQRVGLARVLAQQAPVVLLDEPTSALDLGHQELVMGILRMLAQSGSTVLTVLHDLNLAAAHADRLVLLHEGAKIEVGEPEVVLTEDVLSRTYRQTVRVIKNPHRDCPLVLTVNGEEDDGD